jgi:hypothetical protein
LPILELVTGTETGTETDNNTLARKFGKINTQNPKRRKNGRKNASIFSSGVPDRIPFPSATISVDEVGRR